jgi:uncharacterized protein with GYD domain
MLWRDEVRSPAATVGTSGQRGRQCIQEDGEGGWGGCEQLYWTLGRHDLVTIVEAPDVETATAFGLSVGKLGNVRTDALRAFDESEMATIRFERFSPRWHCR